MAAPILGYTDKNKKLLLSNMSEPTATPLPAGKVPKLGGGGTPQSRYAEQQAQILDDTQQSQYDKEVAAAQAQSARNLKILNTPQLGNSSLDSAIETALKAGQQNMNIGANRVAAKYAGAQLGDLLNAKSASEANAQRANEAQQNAQNTQLELQQKQSVLNRPNGGLSQHFESTADGIMAIDPLTGMAKPVMDASGKPIARAQTDLELQTKLATMHGDVKTNQAVNQGTALLPIKQQELGQKTEQAVNEKQALDAVSNANTARGMGESVSTLKGLLYEGGTPTYDKDGNFAEPETPRILSNTPVDRARMALYEQGGVKDDLAANTISVRNAGKQVVMDGLGGKLGAGTSNADVQFLQEQFGILSEAQNAQSVYRATQAIENRKNQIAERSAQGIKGDYVPKQQNAPQTQQLSAQQMPAGVSPERWAAYQAHINGGK